MAEKKTEQKTGPAAAVQAAVDSDTARGLRGVEVDQTDNHAYTVPGVLAGERVPEMDADPVAAHREAAKPR